MNEQINFLGEKTLVDKSIDRIKFAYEVSVQRGLGALYVCFSGGKDSVVLAELCRIAKERHGVEYTLHYNITGIDPAEVVYFMRKNYPDLYWHQPEKSMWRLIVEKKMPPTRLIRYCCSELKERGGEGRMSLTGVRWAESVRRANRRPFETKGNTRAQAILFNDNIEDRRLFEDCQMKRALLCNPLVDWSDKDVWDFIRERGLPFCSLYDEGWERIGCIGCPMAKTREREMHFSRYPKFKELYIRAFERMLKGMEGATWKTGEEVF